MEFLYRLYNNDYFGIGLFIVITVLAFSFLVILFFGKKDEKARNAEKIANLDNEKIKTSEMENTKNEEFATKTLETISISENEIDEKEKKSFIEEETQYQEPVEIENEEDNSFISDIFTLNRPPEINEKENTLYSYDTEESIMDKREKEIDPFTPIIEEQTNPNIFTERIEEEPIKRPTMPTPFSSVYLSGSKEEETVETEKRIEESRTRPTPIKPEFELPKKVDLPRLNKEAENHNENIIRSLENKPKEEGINNIFSNLEEESYTINK